MTFVEMSFAGSYRKARSYRNEIGTKHSSNWKQARNDQDCVLSCNLYFRYCVNVLGVFSESLALRKYHLNSTYNPTQNQSECGVPVSGPRTAGRQRLIDRRRSTGTGWPPPVVGPRFPHLTVCWAGSPVLMITNVSANDICWDELCRFVSESKIVIGMKMARSFSSNLKQARNYPRLCFEL